MCDLAMEFIQTSHFGRAQPTPPCSHHSNYLPSLAHGAPITMVIHGIDISLAIDELSHHPFHSQTCSQNQRGRAIVHPSVQVCHSVTDQDLNRGRWIFFNTTTDQVWQNLKRNFSMTKQPECRRCLL